MNEHLKRCVGPLVLLHLEPLQQLLLGPVLAHLLVTAVDTVGVAVTLVQPGHALLAQVAREARVLRAGGVRAGRVGLRGRAPLLVRAVVAVLAAVTDLGD